MTDQEAFQALRSLARQHPPLSPEEERNVVARMVSGDREAEEMLVRHNLRLVFDVARRYRTSGASRAELVHEGVFGLVRALRRFDPGRKTKLSTYVTWWIRQAIGRFLKSSTRLIRIPEYLWDGIARAVRAAERTGDDDPRAVAEELDMGEDEARELLAMSRDAVLHDGPAEELREDPDEDSTRSPDVQALRQMEWRRLHAALGNLRPRERKVIEMRYGLGQTEPNSRPRVGRHLGVSAERIRQIEDNALRRLRRALVGRPAA